jgi:EmrB/QacA subfamily drug resistance transporter
MAKKKVVHKGIILFLLALAQFMVVLDVSIVNVALPSMQQALNFGPGNLQWVVTAYTLAFGGFLLLGGRAADLFGRRRMFMFGTILFTIASLACGLAANSGQMVVFRILQGFSAAFMSPAALSIVLTTFKEGNERNKALGIWGAVAAGGAAVGVLLGGLLTEYLNYRWNFYVNVPVGIFVVAMVMRYVPVSLSEVKHRQLDLPGAVLVTSGLMVLVYGLVRAAANGWGSNRTLGFMALAVALLTTFIYNEHKAKEPLMPLRIFKIRNITGANLTQLPIAAGLFSMFFFVTLYVQTVLHFSPVKSGLGFLPVTIFIGIGASNASKLVGRVGYRKILIVAPLVVATGLAILSRIRVDGTYWHDVFPGLAIFAIAMGFVFVSLTIAATSGVAHKESGLASGLLNTSQQIGGALGLAILSSVATSTTANYLQSHPAGQNALAAAQVAGFSRAILVGACFMAIASLAAIFVLREIRGEKSTHVEPIAMV